MWRKSLSLHRKMFGNWRRNLKLPGSGSPSRHLLEGLGTKRPELMVFEFIKVLQIPNIERDDIVDIPKDYVISR